MLNVTRTKFAVKVDCQQKFLLDSRTVQYLAPLNPVERWNQKMKEILDLLGTNIAVTYVSLILLRRRWNPRLHVEQIYKLDQ